MKDRYNNFCRVENNMVIEGLSTRILADVEREFCSDNEIKIIHDYCMNSINNIKYTDDEKKIYNFYMNNILSDLHFFGKITEQDVRVVTQYLALEKVRDMNVKVHFEILPAYLYALKFGLQSLSSCISKRDGSSIIYLKESSFKQAIDQEGCINNKELFALIERVYHEIQHAFQNLKIRNQVSNMCEDKKTLIWIKEYIIEECNPTYYYKNYNSMHIERDATISSVDMTIESFRKHFSYLGYKFIEQMQREALEYSYDTKYLNHLNPQKNYKEEGNAIYIIDSYIDKLALKHPLLVHKQLGIQYQADGQRRGSSELTSEYWSRRSEIKYTYGEKTPSYEKKLQELRELYDYLIWSAKEKELVLLSERHKSKIK